MTRVGQIRAAVGSGAEIGPVLEAFAREPNGGLIVLPDITTMNHRDAIIELATGTVCRRCTRSATLLSAAD